MPTLRKTIRRCGCRATPISIGPSPLSATSGSALSMPSRARKNRSSTTRARRQRILMSKLSAIRSSKADTIATARLSVETSGEGFFEITAEVTRFLEQIGARDGVILIYMRHTSASLVIQENADADVRKNLVTALRRLAPANAGWVHDVEGPDDMPGHVKSMLNGVSLHVPVSSGTLALGTWQGVYLAEHRARPHRREMLLQYIGSRRAE